MNRNIWILSILFLSILFVPVASAKLTITCDKETYGAFSDFDAICQVATTDPVDITVQLPSSMTSAKVEMSVLSNVTDTVSIQDVMTTIANETCGVSWTELGQGQNTYSCGSSLRFCLYLYDSNTTCEYPIYTITGTHQESRYQYIQSEYVSKPVINLGKGKFIVAGINSDFTTTTFKTKIKVPVGSVGKFSIIAKTAHDSGRLDPVWFSDMIYRQSINLSVPSVATPSGYQVKIILNSSNVGADYNWNYECFQGNATRSRFTDENSTELPFWVESCNALGKNLTVWVKSNTSIGSTPYTVYIYFGSSTISPYNGNGSAVFEFFDDASSDRRYLYNTVGVPAGTFTWVNGTEYRIWSSLNNIEVFILSKQKFNATETPYKMIVKAMPQPSAREWRMGISNTGSSAITPFFTEFIRTSNQQNNKQSIVVNSTPPIINTCSSINFVGNLDGAYHLFLITMNATSTFQYVDGTLYKDCYPPAYAPNTLQSIHGYVYKWTLTYASIMYIDSWMVAKLATQEPTYVVGSEEFIEGYVQKDVSAMMDTYTNSVFPNNNYGSSATVTVSQTGSNYTYGYFKFNLSSLPSDISVLGGDLFVFSPSLTDCNKNSTWYGFNDDSWNEMTLTWNNQNLSATGSALATNFRVPCFSYDKIPVGNYVASEYGKDKIVSFQAKASASGQTTAIASKEGYPQYMAFLRVNYTTCVAPNISIQSPVSRIYATYTIPLNASSTKTIDKWWYSINGGANTTFTPNVTVFDLSLLGDGAYQLDVYANTSCGAIGKATVTFEVDTIKPQVWIDYPVNGSIFNYTDMQIYGRAENIHLDTAYISPTWGSNLGNASNWLFSYSSIPENTYIVDVKVNDTAGNVGSATANFTIDRTPPVITVTSPVSGNVYDAFTNISLQVSADEPVTSWSYNLNEGVTVSFTPNTTFQTNVGGINNITVYATDVAGNTGSATVSFKVRPEVTILSPTARFYATYTILLNAVSDVPVDEWLYSVNGSANTSFTPSVDSLNLTSTGDAEYSVVITAGKSGVYGVSSVYFTVDTTKPVIAVTYPANGTHTNASTVDIYGTAENLHLHTVWTDDSAWGSNIGTLEDWNFTYAGIPEGNYVVTISVNDSSGNENYATVNFTVDRIAPMITMTSPVNGATYDMNTNISLDVASDHADMLYWQYSINGSVPVAFTPNTTLNFNDFDDYGLTVYGADMTGNVGSAMAIFTIQPVIMANVSEPKVLRFPDIIYEVVNEINATDSGETIFTVTADNVTINCNGNTLYCDATHPCVFSDKDNTNLVDCHVRSNTTADGIYIENCDYNTIQFSDAISTLNGIHLKNSHHNTISQFASYSNIENGIYLENSNYNTLNGISATRNGYAGIRLSQSSGNTITDLDGSENDYGLILDTSSNSNTVNDAVQALLNEKGYSISNSNSNIFSKVVAFSNADTGFELVSASSNRLSEVTSNENVNYGFHLTGATNNTLVNATADLNNYGLYLDGVSDGNSITGAKIESNYQDGIYMDNSDANILTFSWITGNLGYGISVVNSINNLVFNNVFNNTANNNVDTNGNLWNVIRQVGDRIYSIGFGLGGNYWTNSASTGFSDTCADSTKIGFCDGVYTLNTNNVDEEPYSNKGVLEMVCNESQYFDEFDRVCRVGSIQVDKGKTKVDKTKFRFYILNATLSNWNTTDPTRWVRTNQSLPVNLDIEYFKKNRTLYITESNADKIYVDFDKLGKHMNDDIFVDIKVKKDFTLIVSGDGTDDFYLNWIPKPSAVYKDDIPYTNWSWTAVKDDKGMLSLEGVHMSNMTFDFGFGSDVRSTPIMSLSALIIGLGLLLFVVTTAFSFGNTQATDPKGAIKEMVTNAIGIILILIVAASALYIYLGMPL